MTVCMSLSFRTWAACTWSRATAASISTCSTRSSSPNTLANRTDSCDAIYGGGKDPLCKKYSYAACVIKTT